MKLLTVKCKTEFEKYIESLDVAPYVSMLDNIPSTYLNALIIDFFDSVGLNILITCEFDFGYEILSNRYEVEEEVKKWYETIQQATEEAIKKANDLFNNR